jgi:hypothetical protein
MIGTSSPAKRRMSGRTVANLLTNLALDPFGKIPDKFCAVRAKLVGIKTAAEQATAGIARTAVSWRKASAARSCSAR